MEDNEYSGDVEMAQRRMKRDEEAKDAVEKLTRFVNNFSVNEDAFVDALMREHRTLQQSTFGLFLRCCKRWSELNENQYDARNEYTVQKSREIMKVVDGFTRCPMI